MKRDRLVGAAALALVGVFAAVPSARAAEASRPERRDPAVTVSHVVQSPIVETVIVSGTLVAKEEVLIAPQIDGYAITEILAEEGDRVKAGAVLARLSRETLDASLAQNTAQIARADAAIASAQSAIVEADAARVQAQSSFQRTQTLRSEGVASAEIFDQRQAAARQTAARLASAQQQLNLAEADKALAEAQRKDLMIRLGRTEVKAPFDGVISRRTARLGAVAAAAQEPLFRLIRDGAVELEADVAETVISRIAPGQIAEVTVAGSEKKIAAKVRLISPEVNRSTRLGRVRLDLTGGNGVVIGSFARGEIEITRKDALVAPLSAVLFGPEGARVQVIRNNVVETRTIDPGIRAGGLIEVRGGLAVGDTVVTVSGTFLRQGDRVTPINAR